MTALNAAFQSTPPAWGATAHGVTDSVRYRYLATIADLGIFRVDN
jgi:hypothetical protein